MVCHKCGKDIKEEFCTCCRTDLKIENFINDEVKERKTLAGKKEKDDYNRCS